MTTLSEIIQAYLLDLKARNLATRYIQLHRSTLQELVRFLENPPIEEITPDKLKWFLIYLRGEIPEAAPPQQRRRRGKALAGATADIYYRNMKSMFRWAHEEELIETNPMARVRRPRFEKKIPRALTDQEVEALLRGVRTNGDHNAFRDYCILLFFLDTGVRLAELAGLRVDDIIIEQGLARVLGKGRKERLVPLGLTLRRELAKWLIKRKAGAKMGEKALFINQFGWALGKRGIQSIVKRDLDRYCPDIEKKGPHVLRHTFATMNLRRTHDLKATSLIMGHASTRTTEIYTHLVAADILANHADGSYMDRLLSGRNLD